MPAKRRLTKRRTTSVAELAAWGEVFEFGCDFFGSLIPFGYAWGAEVPSDHIRAAWRRLGADHMRGRDARDWNRPEPWALTEFGGP